MTIAKLASGDLVIHNPITLGDRELTEIDAAPRGRDAEVERVLAGS